MFVYGSVAGYRFYPNFSEKVRSDYSINQGRLTSGLSEGGKSTRYGKEIVSDSKVILNFYSAYKLNFEKLLTAAKDLTKANKTSAFEKRAVEVENPHILKADPDYGALVKVYDVSVKELAAARMDRTDFFNKDRSVVAHFDGKINEGDYKFRITQGGVSEDFSINLKKVDNEGNSNNDSFSKVFEQIADAINNSSLGLTATYGRDMGRSSELRFTVTADEKGTSADYRIEDIGKGTGLIETLGLKNVENARDAVVIIDGVKDYNHYSSGDQVFLFEGHDVELNLSSLGQSYFMVTKDIKEVKDSIEKFASEYSNTLSFLRNTGTNGETDRLIERLVQIARDESDKLKAIGIGVDEQGRMIIEKGLFDGVLERKLEKDFDTVEDILGGLRGIATKVALLADDSLRLSPLRFMNQEPQFNFFDVIKDAYDMMGRMMFQGYGHQGMFIDMSL